MKKYYLAYGMNTNKASMKSRCPDAQSLGKVILPNYSLAFKGVCDIVRTPGKNMECALWTITAECEWSLDILEGYPNFYTKKEVQVEYEGKTIRAMIYCMVDADRLAYPSNYYLSTVSAGYYDHNISMDQIVEALDNVHKFQEDYLCT